MEISLGLGTINLYALARRRKAENADFPKMYLWCGTEDVLITPNRRFHEKDAGSKQGHAATLPSLRKN